MAPTAVGRRDRAKRGGKVSSSCEQSKRIRGCAVDLLQVSSFCRHIQIRSKRLLFNFFSLQSLSSLFLLQYCDVATKQTALESGLERREVSKAVFQSGAVDSLKVQLFLSTLYWTPEANVSRFLGPSPWFWYFWPQSRGRCKV
jgi:hypothetical protein